MAISPQVRRFAAYSLAVALPLGALLVREGFPVSFGQRPLLILFMFPIILSAMLGGLGPGLLSTAVASLCTGYFLVPPTYSMAIAASHDFAQWSMLVANGVLVSFLTETMRAARRRETESGKQLTEAGSRLRETEARFQATFEQAAVGIALVSLEGRWLKVNHKLCGIVGYSQEELMHKTFQEITHPDDLDADLGQVGLLLAGEIQSYAMEKRYFRKGGGEVWVRLTVALVRRADGAPNYFVSVVEDIQSRREAQAALRESEATLREAKRLAGLGHWKWDLRSGLHLWSEEIYALYGRDPSLPAAVYPEVQRYFTPESWANLTAAVEKAIAAGMAYQCDAEVVRPDGGHRWITARGEAVRGEDGEVILLRGTVQDITERKRIEAALRENQERLQLFVEHAPASLAMFDRDMRYVAVSRRWREDYALGERQLLGRGHYEIFPEIPQRWKDIHRRGMGGEVIRSDEDYFQRADGSGRWLRWEVRPWHRAEGGIGGIVVFTEDISRFKEAENEIRDLNAGLERRVAERTAQLSAANTELDSFAYAVSHDLRAPLRAMRGFSKALLEDYGGKLEGEAKLYLEQIDLAGRKMGELVDGILVLSRSTRGGFQRAPLELSIMSSQILDELARQEPGREVACDVEPGLVASGDSAMVEAVLRNLLGNAWKYTAKVGLPRIRVYAEMVDGQPGLCVADNGAGFDMAHAERLFKPFQRLHRQDEFPGLGIGLATVQRIVRRHGGDIRAEGRPGEGAAFCFSLGGGEKDCV